MAEKNHIGERPASRLFVDARTISRSDQDTSRSSAAKPETMSKDERIPSRASTNSEATAPSTVVGLAAPAIYKGVPKPMESKPDLAFEGKTEIRLLAEQELRRGRPLVILLQREDSTAAGSEKASNWVTGFDYQISIKKDKPLTSQYIDLREIYLVKGLSLSIFYGPGNKSNVSVNLSDLKQHDSDGQLIHSILGVNAPGRVTAQQAEGIGLVAACIGAGYIKDPSNAEAQKVLQMLSPDVRKESLRHALVFSCNLGGKPLVDELLRLGADPDVTSDDDGSMPLEIATENERADLVKALLEHGANPDIELSSGMTSRRVAEGTENVTIVKLFEAIPEKAG